MAFGRRRDQQPVQQQRVDDAGHRREREEQRRAERSLGNGERYEGGNRGAAAAENQDAHQRYLPTALAIVLL